MINKILPFFCFLVICFSFVDNAAGRVLTGDEVWQGKVTLADDVLVPAGLTLTIKPGTIIKVRPAEDTKIDPEYLSHRTEILVRGSLLALGTTAKPISFTALADDNGNSWAGIIVDDGQVDLAHCRINDAQNGLYVLKGKVSISDTSLSKNHYGLIAHGAGAKVDLRRTVIKNNDYGLFSFNNAGIKRQDVEISHNRKKDFWSSAAAFVKISPKVYELPALKLTKVYKNETINGFVIWHDRVRVEGQVRVAPKGRLVIMPGTVVEFTKRDSNGDAIGENGILAQGGFIAKGTPKRPIIFRSAEANPAMGDWDAINILGSDQSRNLIEFCQIEDAYRALHFHFSNVAVDNVILRHNYRGLQFQESLVEIRNCQFYRNKSAVQCRDSEGSFKNNQIFDNINGVSLFRQNLIVSDNLIANNSRDGLRVREGETVVGKNMMVGNRFGMLVSDAVFGRFDDNLLAGNLENGLSLRNIDHLKISGNAVLGNGLNGITVRDSRGEILGNQVADNGERGMAIMSFVGTVSGNNIVDNGLYGMGLDGGDNISASGNWWGEADMAQTIYDRHDDPGLGLVTYEPQEKSPLTYTWPVSEVPIDLAWSGVLQIPEVVTVNTGETLTVKPGTEVEFAKTAGLYVSGVIQGQGQADKRISFTSIAKSGPEDWGEITLNHALGSYFHYCDFRYASWGIHCHYTNLDVDFCRFLDSGGGFRFRSGPVEIKNTLFARNHIGLRAFMVTADIHHNSFNENEMAIFVRKKGSGIKIHHNNFINNERYNIRVGDFDEEDVDARYNWWNGDNELDKIFDGRRDASLGKVIYEPELKEAVKLKF